MGLKLLAAHLKLKVQGQDEILPEDRKDTRQNMDEKYLGKNTPEKKARTWIPTVQGREVNMVATMHNPPPAPPSARKLTEAPCP